MADSSYAHPYQASAEGRRTRTYRTAGSRDVHAQQWADQMGRTVNLWEHSTSDGWGLTGRMEPSQDEEHRPCNEPGCEAPLEANPELFLSLNDDGTWDIEGLGGENRHVTCAEGHRQNDAALETALNAFLEQLLPGVTAGH